MAEVTNPNDHSVSTVQTGIIEHGETVTIPDEVAATLPDSGVLRVVFGRVEAAAKAAEDDAKRVIDSAKSEATRLLNEAKDEAKRIVDAASDEIAKVKPSVDDAASATPPAAPAAPAAPVTPPAK